MLRSAALISTPESLTQDVELEGNSPSPLPPCFSPRMLPAQNERTCTETPDQTDVRSRFPKALSHLVLVAHVLQSVR